MVEIGQNGDKKMKINIIYKLNDKITYKEFERFLYLMGYEQPNIRKLFTYSLRNKEKELTSLKNTINITARTKTYKTLIGFIKIITDYSYFFYFTDTMVLSDYRGKGIGRGMVEMGLDYCRKNGFIKIFLTPAKGTEQFYERLGFDFGKYPQMVILGKEQCEI